MDNDVHQRESFSMFALLSTYLHTDEIVEIYTSLEDTNKFSAGKIYGLSEDHVLIAHLHPYGQYDGFVVKSIDDIYQVCVGTQYCRRLKQLSQLKGTSHERIAYVSENQLYNILHYALLFHKVISIELLQSSIDDVIGTVIALNEHDVHIAMYTENGESNGKSIIYLGDITHLVCDSDYEAAIELLLNNQK